jgi:serine/threonine protein kinase
MDLSHLPNVGRKKRQISKTQTEQEEECTRKSIKLQSILSRESQQVLSVGRTSGMTSEDLVDIDDFTKVRVIGKGSYGQVFLVMYRGKQMALKQVNKEFVLKCDRIKSVYNEKSALEDADTIFMPTFQFTFQDQDSLYFVIEYVPYCLKEIIGGKGLAIDVVRFYAA